MTDKQKVQVLKTCFDDVIWMAIRYAHGRHTYAPSTIRSAVNRFKDVFPDYELKEDKTLEKPNEEDFTNFLNLREDYLNDLFEK